MKSAGIALFLVLLSSCRVAEKSIPGTYQPGNGQLSRLILKNDKTFELSFLDPVTSNFLPGTGTPTNFFTTGNWRYDKNKLVLTSSSNNQYSRSASINDSITRFTTISSFNFWNRYGDPVSIRYIILPPMNTKPHFGNSLYFFSQDFKATDTLRFYFEGYPPFSFPGSVPPAIGNNIHKITLYEPYRPAAFTDLRLAVKKNRLAGKNGLHFRKKHEL